MVKIQTSNNIMGKVEETHITFFFFFEKSMFGENIVNIQHFLQCTRPKDVNNKNSL